MKPIDIAPADLEIVQRILSQYVPSLEVRAFGSRVTWNARATSDLDLALFTTEPLDFALKAELRETFAQSDLSFRVDIVDWAATSKDFQEVIEQEYVVLQDRRQNEFKNMAFQWSELEAGRSALGNAAKKDLEKLSIRWPCHKQDRKTIARILGTLDDKIELNHQLNQTSEEIAQALFKSWFIDFDPVNERLEKHRRSRQFLPCLPAEIYNLFPDCLAESSWGKLPRGWTVQPLRECFSLKMGQSPPSNTYNQQGEGIPFFQGRAEFGFRFPENRKFCTHPIRVAAHGDTLVSVRAPADMNVAREPCCIGQGIAALRHRSGSSSFTYYYATLVLQQELRPFDPTGTVFGSINENRFEGLNVIEPPLEIINAFDALAKPLDRQILTNCAESQALASLKSILLSCLMSDQCNLLNKKAM